jgi:predicted ATPase/DNA-binding CsgD family transcriptional regulator
MNISTDEQLASSVTQLHPVPTGRRGARSNLPAALTSLIGRAREGAAVSALLHQEDVRLVTFIGPGGVGKTQLALAVARKLCGAFADGVTFVPLAPLSDPALVVSAIAQELGVHDSGSRPLLDGVRAVLQEQELLLLLDNLEHLRAAAPLIADLLTSCPDLKVLTTSRELLHLAGEHAFDVRPLALPDRTESLLVDELTSYDAIRLFVTRAKEVKPDFVITDANARAVTEICWSLDGLPLALELAAARVRVLAPVDLVVQLTNRLQILTGGHRDAPERLQTMRHAIAWSYDLLTPEEQRLFRRLSVFVGGFSLERAEAVGVEESVLDPLTSLVDKNLVYQVEQPNGETRFSMLETIREFGLEQLAANADLESARDAHAAAFVALAEAALPHYDAGGWVDWCDRIEADRDNCHAALAWADASGDAEMLARLAGALWRFEFARGDASDEGRWLERALARRDAVSPAALTEVLDGMACFYIFVVGDMARAEALATELLAHAEAIGDAYGACDGLNYLVVLALRRSDNQEAAALANRALALAPTARSPETQIILAISSLAIVAFHQGDLDAAATQYADALARSRELDYLFGIEMALTFFGQVRLAQGMTKDAAALIAEGLTLATDGRDSTGIEHGLNSLAVVAIATGQIREAAHLLGAVDALRLRHGLEPEVDLFAVAVPVALQARQAMGDEVFAEAHEAGQKMPPEEAIQLAFRIAEAAASDAPPIASTTRNGLTPRELAVLRLLVEGLSDKEIAETLRITRRTASKHVETIRDKFDVPSRTAAATYAARHGII